MTKKISKAISRRKTRRAERIWKGSGLSIVLDMIATLLANGDSTVAITEDKSDEFGMSQIFIAIEVDRLIDGKTKEEKLKRIMDYVTSAEPSNPAQLVRLPGHKQIAVEADHHVNGIPVDEAGTDGDTYIPASTDELYVLSLK